MNSLPKTLIEVLNEFSPKTTNLSSGVGGDDEKYKNNLPLKELVVSLKNKDEDKICEIFKKYPHLIHESIFLQEHNLDMVKKETLRLKKDLMDYQESRLTPLQYALFHQFEKVAEYAFKNLSSDQLKQAHHINTRKSYDMDRYVKTNSMKISPIDILLLHDNLTLWQKIEKNKLLEILGGKPEELVKKVFQKSLKIEQELLYRGKIGKCYPQKIYHELLQEPYKFKSMPMYYDTNEYLRLAAHLQDTKILKAFMTSQDHTVRTIEAILNFNEHEKISGVNHINLNTPTSQKNAILTVLKVHYELHQEVPYCTGGNNEKIPLMQALIHKLSLSGSNPLIEELMNYPEIQKQAQDFYQKHPEYIHLEVLLKINKNTGLNLLKIIDENWDKTNNKPNYKAHDYLLDVKDKIRDYVSYKEDNRKEMKESVKKFILFCYTNKSYLFEQKKKGKSLFNCLEDLDMKSLKDEIQIKFEKKALKEIVQKAPIKLKSKSYKLL